MQNAETVLEVLRERGAARMGADHGQAPSQDPRGLRTLLRQHPSHDGRRVNHGTVAGEPGELKGSRRVREGARGNGAPPPPRLWPTSSTRAYDDRHLARVCDQAAWLSRRRRRWCRRGAVPVVCLVRARGVQRLERNVLVVSIDRLIPVLRSAAGGAGAGAPRRCPRAAELSERSTRHAEWRTTTRGVGPMTRVPDVQRELGGDWPSRLQG